MTDAIIEGKSVLCGKCRHKIAEQRELRIGLGRGTIYIKCKHKDGSKTPSKCNTINRIKL